MQNHAISTPMQSVPRPGYRLVPAALGPFSNQTIVHIPCPNDCVTDHVADGVRYAEDIDHWGETIADWEVDCLTRPADRMLSLDARLHWDPAAADPRLRAAHVLLDDESTSVFLDPEMTDQAADDMIAFAVKLRHLAQRARLANQTAGDSDPNMDEALRRVRGGAA